MALEVIPRDTTPEADAVQMEIYRRMPALRRFEQTLEMAEMMRRLCTAGVRGRHPDYTEEQVRLALIRLVLGDGLFRQVYPGEDVRP
jgi:hypothetical protein